MPYVMAQEPRSSRRGGFDEEIVLMNGTSQYSPVAPVGWRRTNATRVPHCAGQASSARAEENPSLRSTRRAMS